MARSSSLFHLLLNVPLHYGACPFTGPAFKVHCRDTDWNFLTAMIHIYIYIFFHIRKSMRRTTRVGLVPSNRFTHMGCFHFSKKDKNKGPEGLNNPRTAWPHYLCEIPTTSQGQHVQSIETWAVNFQKGKDDWTNIVCVQSLPTGNGRPFIFRSLYN